MGPCLLSFRDYDRVFELSLLVLLLLLLFLSIITRSSSCYSYCDYYFYCLLRTLVEHSSKAPQIRSPDASRPKE